MGLPAVDYDLDRRIRWADGGRTCDCGMFPLCRHDHPAKDGRGWRYQLAGDSRVQWTRKPGHTYYSNGRPP